MRARTNKTQGAGALVEKLEKRSLMSASISGEVFHDLTGNSLTPDDTPLAGATILLYRDVNHNGKVDAADGLAIASDTTGADGKFSFAGLPLGHYLTVESSLPGTVRTFEPLTNVYAVNANSNSDFAGHFYANYVKNFNSSRLKNISYLINGTKRVKDLGGNVQEGQTIEADFTVTAGAPIQLTLVMYDAPSGVFDPKTAHLQTVEEVDTATFGPGKHSLFLDPADCYFQVDFVGGPVITQFGPNGSNIFYKQEGRLIDSAAGGTNPCPIPEPSAAGIIALASLRLLARRRQKSYDRAKAKQQADAGKVE